MDTSAAPRPSGGLLPSLPRPFEGRWAKGVLTLVAAPDLNERSWGAWFGDLQTALDERQWKGLDIRVCVVDLRPCRWADPLPLLSLALSLANFEAKGGEVRLYLPEACPKPGETRRANSGRDIHLRECLDGERLLKFMAREGFLDLLTRVQPVTRLEGIPQPLQQTRQTWSGTLPLTMEHISELRELRPSLAFEESTCVPAALLALGTDPTMSVTDALESIDRWVRRIIQTRIHPVVMDKVPAWAHGSLLYRFQILLRETLHNIVEHAYSESGGLAAVYVRYREGRLGQAPTAWSAMERHIKREDDSSRIALMKAFPTYQAFSRTRAGFFEVYILDGGCGLIERLLQNEAVKHIRASANPLHEVMREVFNGRSTRPDRPTEKGGLYLLRHLLEPARDYLRSRDADSWWGMELPLPMTQSETTPAGQFTVDCGAARHDCRPVNGLAWTIRLSWLDRMDSTALPEVGNWREMTQEDRRPLLAVLKSNAVEPAELFVSIEDWRLTGAAWGKQAQDRYSDVLVVLPHRDWMKNRIQDRLIEPVKAGRLRPMGMLVVGDIVSEEALTYLLAIRRARRLVTGLDGIPARIILVTRDLRSIVLRLQDELYQVDEDGTAAFVSGKSSWSLADYFCALRSHDGRRLWETIDSGEDGPQAAFRREWVDWHDGRCLDGYLDFPATLTNPVCRAIYNLTLERLTALFPQRDCRLIPLDNLVDSLIIRFRAQQRPRGSTFASDTRAGVIDVYVGSVRVTGITEQDHSPQNEHPTVFHFFCHPSGDSFRRPGDSSSGHYLLPWLEPLRGAPPHNCTDATQPRDWYRRIGRTPGIAQGGWKAFRVPRFDEDGQSLYEATPYETYGAWQDPSRTPLRLGHWSYGGHHDLLTVNLLLAFDTELDQISLALGGRLARFVYANLFTALGISREHLKDEGKRLWDMIEKDAFRRLIPGGNSEQGGILIFPSHPVTDHVFGRLTGWLENQDKLRTVLNHCVPILPLRRHRGGSGIQLSGLTLERLQSFVTQNSVPPVTFFDDAMISGHTFQAMKSLLHGLGFHKVYSVVMLDRQRLPSAHHVNRQVDQSSQGQTPNYQNVCYWRLDAPTIGSRAHCPLCKGLGRVRDLAGGIKSPERRERALRWLDIWMDRNPATDWGDAGLRSIPVELNKSNRKFCIVPDPNNATAWKQAGTDGKEIVLSNSAGMVAWVTELHSITARDDLAVKLLDPNSDKLSPEVRIQLCASQLLLFHGEFDRDLAAKLGYQLVLALFEAPSHDRNTALAAITLLACGNMFLKDALERLQSSLWSGHDTVVSDRETNLDFLTLLDLSNVMETRARSTLRPSPSIFSAPLRRETYRLLQETICSGEPDHHSSPFSRFQDVSSPVKSADRGHLERVIEAAASLQRRLDEIRPDWFRYHNGAAPLFDNYDDFRKTVEDRLRQLNTPIKNVLGSRRRETTSELDLDQCKDLARDVLSDGHRIALAVFTPLGLASLRNERRPLLMDELQKSVNLARKGDRFIAIAELTEFDYREAARCLETGKEEYYVVWDSLIRNALDRILSNVRHADKDPISCPWPELADASRDQQANTAHLWARLDIQKEYVAILLRNHAKMPADEVTAKTADKPWIKTFVELGGAVTYANPSSGKLLQTTIRIPYSFFLDSPGPSGNRS
jgi:hypothetical protein